jgi:hypothetical protein
MELVTKIVKHCEEYDWPWDPKGMYMQAQNAINGCYEHHKRDSVLWATARECTPQDICSVRLVCKQFKIASLESFGAILGHRRFRLTKIGLQDLHNISEITELVPWIKTLTFGTAQIDYSQRERYINQIFESVRDVEAIQTVCVKDMVYEQSKEPEKLMIKVLLSFRNLENARIIVEDWLDYLGGWLMSEQEKFVDTQYFRRLQSGWYFYCRQSQYKSSRKIPATILRAFSETNVVIKDMRFSYGWSPRNEQARLLPAWLKTLRIELEMESFDENKTLVRALADMRGLEDLALTFKLDILLSTHNDNYNSEYEYMTTNIIEATNNATKLRRVSFENDWFFTEHNIVAFVQQHALSLQHLMIHRCTLHGSWLQVLHAIAEITRDKLEGLSILFPQTAYTGMLVREEEFEGRFVSEWPDSSCKTYIGPSLLLQYDIATDYGYSDNSVVEEWA